MTKKKKKEDAVTLLKVSRRVTSDPGSARGGEAILQIVRLSGRRRIRDVCQERKKILLLLTNCVVKIKYNEFLLLLMERIA